MAMFPMLLLLFAGVRCVRGTQLAKTRLMNATGAVRVQLWHDTLEESFDVIDNDGNEHLDASELTHYFKTFGRKISTEFASHLIRT